MAPTPMINSDTAYKNMGDDFVFRLHFSLHFPPIHEPRERPNMNTETTTDRTGVITPKDAKAILSHTIW